MGTVEYSRGTVGNSGRYNQGTVGVQSGYSGVHKRYSGVQSGTLGVLWEGRRWRREEEEKGEGGLSQFIHQYN